MLDLVSRRKSATRRDWYAGIYHKAFEHLGNTRASPEAVHGALLAVGELVSNSGDFMLERFNEVRAWGARPCAHDGRRYGVCAARRAAGVRLCVAVQGREESARAAHCGDADAAIGDVPAAGVLAAAARPSVCVITRPAAQLFVSGYADTALDHLILVLSSRAIDRGTTFLAIGRVLLAVRAPRPGPDGAPSLVIGVRGLRRVRRLASSCQSKLFDRTSRTSWTRFERGLRRRAARAAGAAGVRLVGGGVIVRACAGPEEDVLPRGARLHCNARGGAGSAAKGV